MDVKTWLKGLGLDDYAEAFVENGVDGELLRELTNEDLKDLGVARLADRKRLLKAIEELAGEGGQEQHEDAVPASSEAERRQLTVMFCDLAGSTALSTRLDPEDYREVIRTYQDACAGVVARYDGYVAKGVVARYDGYVAKFMGDGVLAYFGWPRGHEDDAGRAISAGLGIVQTVSNIAPADSEAEPLAVRIGIATGPVVVGDIVGEGAAQEAAVTGETPNLAARLQEIAKPNSVVIAGTTFALAGGLFDYEDLGGQTLKGIDGLTKVWRVMGERRVESRFAAAHTTALTPLIGREEELDLLSRRWERAKGGNGQVVLLSGEPGIGKSRLTQALQDWIGDEPHTRLLFQCSPHHTSSALYPTINQLEFAARFDSGDGTNSRLDKLEALLLHSGQPIDEAMPLIAALLSIPANDRYALPELTPQQQKDRTLAALIDQLVGLAAQQPVLFIFEDAHWIDPTSMELLERAIERITDLPVLMVITYRPEFAAPWIGLPHVTLQALNRLTPKDCARMAERLIGDRHLSAELLNQITERTDGVPLFIEELTRSVVEFGGADAGEHVDIVIPVTLQDALEARFDRSPAVREVAQVGAAIGREFGYDLLSQASSISSPDLDSALDDLTESGLIFVRGTPPDATYTFKHALIQDTAYDSMVRSKRHDTHRRIAEQLQQLHPEIVDTEPETLAHHYTEAGLFEDAIGWWTRAGQAASARSANPEAIVLLGRGLNLVADLTASEVRDRHELALQTALFGPLISIKGQTSPELEAAFNRTLELCENVDAPEEMFRALFAKSIWHVNRGELILNKEAAEDMIQRANRASDDGALLMGHRLVTMSLLFLGKFIEAQKHIDIVLSTFDRERHGDVMLYYGQDPAVITESYSAVNQWALGWPDKSRSASEGAISKALALDHAGTIGPVLTFAGMIAQSFRRDIDGLRRAVKHFQSLTSQYNMPVWDAVYRISDALIRSMDSPSGETATKLRAELENWESLTRSPTISFPFLWGLFLAENYLAIGDQAKALEAIDKGFNFAKASGELLANSELLRLRGVALARCDSSEGYDEAEACLRHALEDARSRDAKSFELRAATSLAQFLRDQRCLDEARDVLAPVYGWFTEGFDTPDLKDAKALLDELT
jgi:class 3 adenylate cyclase/predicted ATPase